MLYPSEQMARRKKGGIAARIQRVKAKKSGSTLSELRKTAVRYNKSVRITNVQKKSRAELVSAFNSKSSLMSQMKG
jgi:hypothetical protein